METRESSKYSLIRCLVYADVISDQQAENTYLLKLIIVIYPFRKQDHAYSRKKTICYNTIAFTENDVGFP